MRSGAVDNSSGCQWCAGSTRVETSALFSLARLTAMAAVPEDRPAPRRPTGVPQPAGGDESSGLIDLRAIQSLLGERGPHAPLLAGPLAASVSPLAASVSPLAAPTSPPRPARASSLERRLSLLLAAIMLCTAGLAGVVLLRAVSRPGPGPLVPRYVVAPGATEIDAAPPEVKEEASAEVEAAEPAAVPTVSTPAAGPVREASPRRRSERRGAPESPRRVEEPTTPAPAPEKAAAKEDYPVACLIDPAKCPRKREEAPAPVAIAPDPGDSLPATLEPADIGEGTRAARAAAVEQCRSLAKGGEAITIKLSIAGPTGSVLRATPEDDAGNPQLAACSARELAAASFKKVKKPQIGAVVTVKF